LLFIKNYFPLTKPLHIVCLDAPSPADYGGAIDLFHSIPALASEGYSITLHYFDYKPGRSAKGLEPYLAGCYSYKRSGFIKSLVHGEPYIISSRNNKELLTRLQADDAPVLLQGLHCTGFARLLSPTRKVLIRMHNDEALYYQNLLKNETRFFATLVFQDGIETPASVPAEF
jgi:hypothetical protein